MAAGPFPVLSSFTQRPDGSMKVDPPFMCPVARCAFRAKSSAAKCGMHGRTVVPV